MKIPINEGAARLSLHPCEFILKLSQMIESFDDIYPEVDENYVDNLKQLTQHISKKSSFGTTEKNTKLQISKDAHSLISVLHSKKYWENNRIDKAILKNHYCNHIADLEATIKELQRLDIVLIKKGGNALSLKSKKKNLIEDIIFYRYLKDEASKKEGKFPNKGFTLIELLFSLSIMAILAAIAIVNYSIFVEKIRALW
jgi:prepilin-type N-terminal cleavage/methylation domain-containing protein